MQNLSSLLESTTPQYSLEIPSTGENKNFRPFLVKEEKVLLLAQESNNENEIINSIKNTVKSCVADIDNIDELTPSDLEYIFIQLRSKSVGEMVSPTIICPETGESVEVNLSLNDLTIKRDKNHTKNIKIKDDLIITMKYPTIRMIQEKNLSIDQNASDFYDLIVECIEKIQTTEELLDADFISFEEKNEFVENMTNSQFKKIMQFFVTSPKIEYTIHYNTSDGVERKMVLNSIMDFFG